MGKKYKLKINERYYYNYSFDSDGIIKRQLPNFLRQLEFLSISL